MKRLIWLEWALLLAALAAFTITEQYRPYVTVGLGLLAASFGLRWLRTGKFVPRSGLELSAILFIASAALATWIAVDRPTAMLQMARILAAAALFYAIVSLERAWLPWLAAGLVAAAAFLALYWPLQHDFAAETAKFAAITNLGLWLNGHLPAIPGPSIHANVAAGTLALALPFDLALAWQAWQAGRKPLALLAAAAGLLIAAGLLMTSSRGAWVGLAGMLGLALMAWLQRRRFATSKRQAFFWGLSAIAGLGLAAALAATGWLERLLGQLPDPTGSMTGRTHLWLQGLPLIRDYLFTGSGLMGFRILFGIYGLLIHSPYQDHLHNTYLEVWLEQGLLGFIGFALGALVIAGWAWKVLARRQISIWGWAGLAALAVAGLHGIFDVVFYVTRTLPLIGLVGGFAWWLLEQGQGQPEAKPTLRTVKSSSTVCLLKLAAAGALLLLALIFHRPLLSAFYANLGALSQTRTEMTALGVDNFDNPTLDEIRQRSDLGQAEAYFHQALRWNPANLTALQRLSAIALSRGQPDQALAWMQTAWEAGSREEITRLLLGDALAALGQTQSAAETVRGLTWAEGRLMFQAWYRYERQGDLDRAALAWQAVLALNPHNQQALDWLAAHP